MALEPQCIALSGGVGGAKLALGLSLELAADRLSVIVNTGDDFDHLGLRVCPDLDTLMYTLSGKANQELGWGQASETWSFLSALSDLGGEDWFKLGDRDLATHVLRTQMLGSGSSLTDATRALMTALGVKTVVLPMTDDRVATEIHCQSGETLAFQHYFVRDRCEPPISGVSFSGMESARRTTQFNALLEATVEAAEANAAACDADANAGCWAHNETIYQTQLLLPLMSVPIELKVPSPGCTMRTMVTLSAGQTAKISGAKGAKPLHNLAATSAVIRRDSPRRQFTEFVMDEIVVPGKLQGESAYSRHRTCQACQVGAHL